MPNIILQTKYPQAKGTFANHEFLFKKRLKGFVYTEGLRWTGVRIPQFPALASQGSILVPCSPGVPGSHYVKSVAIMILGRR